MDVVKPVIAMKKILAIVLLTTACLGFGQQHFFVGPHVEYGYFFKDFAANRNVLRTNSIGSIYNMKAAFTYRVANTISLEMGAGFKRMGWKLRDQNFAERNDGFEISARSVGRFANYFGNIQYSQKIDKKTYWYLQMGYSYDVINQDSLNESRAFIRNNEQVEIKTFFTNNTYALTPALGIQWFDLYDNMWSVGLKYNMILGANTQNIDYQVTNNEDIIAQDRAVASGSYIALDVKYNFMFLYKAKKERKPRKEKDPEINNDVIVDQPDSVIVNDDQINDREIVTLHRIKVKSPNITIKVYDHQMVDGDIVSLYLNDHWILEEYSLLKEKKEIQVTVEEGENSLILYALNLGKYSPNTAAIIIDDGNKEQQVILESNMKESGTLQIKYKP